MRRSTSHFLTFPKLTAAVSDRMKVDHLVLRDAVHSLANIEESFLFPET